MKIVISMLLIIFVSFPVIAESEQFQRSGSYIEVTVEYISTFPGYVQIKDEECKFTASVDCEKARLRLERDDCRNERPSAGCREAEQLLATSFCTPGLVYEGMASQGDRVTVSICKSSGGFGTLAVRNLRNGEMWTKYFLLTDGNVVKYQ